MQLSVRGQPIRLVWAQAKRLPGVFMSKVREFDIIVYGATGYTGRLVAEYLSKRTGAPKWAMAGRSLSKLEQVRDEIGAPEAAAYGLANRVVADHELLDTALAWTCWYARLAGELSAPLAIVAGRYSPSVTWREVC